MTATGSKNGRPVPSDVTELRQEIAQTRADLGETVEALAAKADVKARAQEAVAEVKTRAYETVDEAMGRLVEGAQQAKASAVQVGRELRAHPTQQVQSAVARLRRSVLDHPAPWAVAAGLLVLVAFVSPRRWRR
jgi:hypothetical protein